MKEAKIIQENIDEKAIQLFLKTLEIAGGPRKLIEKKHLTWVPSLIEACYAVILAESGKTQDEIAQFLGIGSQTVRNILRANPEGVKQKLEEEMEKEEKEIKTHIAGGLAKLAYEELKKENPSS